MCQSRPLHCPALSDADVRRSLARASHANAGGAEGAISVGRIDSDESQPGQDREPPPSAPPYDAVDDVLFMAPSRVREGPSTSACIVGGTPGLYGAGVATVQLSRSRRPCRR
jgi:hypothetical protein